jgi:hydrogenase maturation protease
MGCGVLVAGAGTIFLGDDGSGAKVTERLASAAPPAWLRVADFGVRGVRLA